MGLPRASDALRRYKCAGSWNLRQALRKAGKGMMSAKISRKLP
jgi:hypothetical protein